MVRSILGSSRVHTVYNILVYLPHMVLEVLSVLQDIQDLLVSVLVTVTQPAEDGEVLDAGSLNRLVYSRYQINTVKRSR